MTGASTSDSPGHDDRGTAFVEILVTIMLLGVAVVAILFSLLGITTSSGVHRRVVATDAMLRSSAEAILSRQTPYVDCAGAGSYSSVIPIDPEGDVTVTIDAVQVWAGDAPPSYQNGCVTDPGATLIRLQASTDSHTHQLEIVKRRSGS